MPDCLAVQVRQSRSAQNTATYQSVNQGFNSINGLIAAGPSPAQIRVDGSLDPESLSPADRYRYWVTTQCYVNQFSQMHSLYQSGALSKTLWETHLDALAGSAVQRNRDQVNAPEDLWRAVDDYGAPTRSSKNYHGSGLPPDT